MSATAIKTPDFLSANNDSDWTYYVPDRGDLDESFMPIGYPDEFEYERLWMAPCRLSDIPPEERNDSDPAVTRDALGRFEPVIFWEECREGAPGAVAFFGARYAA